MKDYSGSADIITSTSNTTGMIYSATVEDVIHACTKLQQIADTLTSLENTLVNARDLCDKKSFKIENLTLEKQIDNLMESYNNISKYVYNLSNTILADINNQAISK